LRRGDNICLQIETKKKNGRGKREMKTFVSKRRRNTATFTNAAHEGDKRRITDFFLKKKERK